ncbi:gamma-aminobutyric acid receptor subunit pi [Rhinatrema bivittatum]|uniref:gamma-aminobutyric acid receptor subunit pi n=1 Tax=Rhinatrema bivittatum TaxID=194408 RepID=UPI0011293C82|nr:gamma-aminobutyric acid receptor subunit pi [Rhinatrema bivittatum]
MYHRNWNSVILWLFLCLSSVQDTKGSDTEVLPGFQNLTKGYNKYLRPRFDGKPVEVAMSLEIASIDAISEINMDYTAMIFLRQRWTDERLVFEGNKSLSLDARLAELLWVPDTYIVDSKKSFLHDVTAQNRLIRIFSNGTVLYAIRITTTVACNMDLSKYPMDKQMCKLQLESWGYSVNDLVFTWIRGNDSIRGLENLSLSQYTVERYYTLVSKGKYETGVYPRLILFFELRRNFLYFVLETYIPATLLVILSWVSFWISLSSVPARTCIGVTTVLAMTTLMMGSRTSLPTSNCFIKALDVFLGICFTFIFGALLEYAAVHYCQEQHSSTKKDSKSPPEELKEVKITSIIGSSLPSLKRRKSLNQAEHTTEDSSKSSSATSDLRTSENTFMYMLKIKWKMSKFMDYFTVENPYNIDRYSRILFPLSFMIVNLFYWAYYLYM